MSDGAQWWQAQEQTRRKKALHLNARKSASAAEARGQRVGDSLADYESLSTLPDRRMVEALISRHNVRMNNLKRLSDDYRFMVVSAIGPAAHLDSSLLSLGASLRRPPTAYLGRWPDRLLWGVDSSVSASRLLLSGQIVGAAMMARNQMERWLTQRAAALRLTQTEGESTVDFIARVWSVPDPFYRQWYGNRLLIRGDGDENETRDGVGEPPLDHLHVYRADGTEVCPASTYAVLSETLHGRENTAAVLWDAHRCSTKDYWYPHSHSAAYDVCCAIFLTLRELRIATISLAEQRGRKDIVDNLSAGIDSISQGDRGGFAMGYTPMPLSARRTRPVRAPSIEAIAPLLPNEGLNPGMARPVVALGADFAAILNGGSPVRGLYRDDEMILRVFAWHRARAIRVAQDALNHEKELLGDDFDIRSLTSRASRWVVLTECLSLLSHWNVHPEIRISAAVTGSALRSCYWLWLEDDDRAMSVLRVALEHVARMRSWRLKSEKSAQLHSSARSTPRDWLELAGWKRLRLLNRVLGEFAHAKDLGEWPALREILAELQMDVESSTALFTARGSAIDFVSKLAALEYVEQVRRLSPALTPTVERVLGVFEFDVDPNSRDLEKQFAHIWEQYQEQRSEQRATPTSTT